MRAPVGRAWSGLVVLPERADGDCRLVGCGRLDTDDDNVVAAQCIRPAGHEGPCRRVSSRDLEDVEDGLYLAWFRHDGRRVWPQTPYWIRFLEDEQPNDYRPLRWRA